MPDLSHLPTWIWFIISGVCAGLCLAYLFDHLHRWITSWFVSTPSMKWHFSPKGGCTEAIVQELAAAHNEILIQAYSFTSKEIAEAIRAAAQRGVKVIVLLDKSNEKDTHSELGDLRDLGIDLMIDAAHAISHNKVMILDSSTVLTGSFNFTNQAEHENAENLLILRNQPELAKAYRQNFFNHHSHGQAPGTAVPGSVHLHRAA